MMWVAHLDSCSVGHSLIRVDGLAELLAVEEVLEHLLHLGDTGGSTDQHNLVHLPHISWLAHLRSHATQTLQGQLKARMTSAPEVSHSLNP